MAMRRPLEPLPEAREEVRRISVSGATVFMNDGASCQQFLVDSGNCSVLHFATHAVVDASHPDHSAIVLANSELVNAREIERLQHARVAMAEEGYPARDGMAFAMIGATATPVEALQHESPLPGIRVWMALARLGLIVVWFRFARQS